VSLEQSKRRRHHCLLVGSTRDPARPLEDLVPIRFLQVRRFELQRRIDVLHSVTAPLEGGRPIVHVVRAEYLFLGLDDAHHRFDVVDARTECRGHHDFSVRDGHESDERGHVTALELLDGQEDEARVQIDVNAKSWLGIEVGCHRQLGGVAIRTREYTIVVPDTQQRSPCFHVGDDGRLEQQVGRR